MNSQGRQPVAADDQYEATVLDFLDKEMAIAQEAQKKNQQSDELDALVTDLLKQVITEADQTPPQAQDRPLFDDDELFAGMAPGQTQVVEASTAPNAAPPAEETLPASPQKEAVAEPLTPSPEEDHAAKAEAQSAAAPAVMFGSSMAAPQKKFPLVAAIVAGMVVVLGAGFYFFSGSSAKSPVNPEPPAAAVQQTKLETSNPPAQVATSNVNPAQPVAKPTSPAAGTPAATAAPVKQAAAPAKPNTGSTDAVKPSKPAAANAKAEAAPAAPVKSAGEEKPVQTPVVATPPPPVQTAAVEKTAPPSVTEHSAPVTPSVPEKKPVPTQSASVVEPPAPAPQPAHSTPVAKNLIEAVPLMQASPAYPELAVRARLSGSVVLDVQINDQGKVTKATPVSGPNIFYSSAVAAVMKWRYKPASIGGVNVPSQSRVTMAFKMKN